MLVMHETELAYLAGLLDGEGTVAAIRRKRRIKDHPEKHGDVYVLTVSIYNTHEPTVRWVHGQLAGSLIETHRERYRSIWRWQCQQTAARDVLVTLLPYLRIKNQQARVAIELWSLIDEYRASIKGLSNLARRLPEVEHERRGVLVAKLSRLNRRGVFDP